MDITSLALQACVRCILAIEIAIADRLKTALPFFQKLCEAVGHFHRLNPTVVHRDLKPSNILMMKTAAGGYRVRISDFGISQLAAQHTLEQADASTPNLSMAGTLRGELIFGDLFDEKARPSQCERHLVPRCLSPRLTLSIAYNAPCYCGKHRRRHWRPTPAL